MAYDLTFVANTKHLSNKLNTKQNIYAKLTRIAFICNVCFILTFGHQWLTVKMMDKDPIDWIITLGICASVINLITVIYYGIFNKQYLNSLKMQRDLLYFKNFNIIMMFIQIFILFKRYFFDY